MSKYLLSLSLFKPQMPSQGMFYLGEKARGPTQQSQTKHGQDLSTVPSALTSGLTQAVGRSPLPLGIQPRTRGSSCECFPSYSATCFFPGGGGGGGSCSFPRWTTTVDSSWTETEVGGAGPLQGQLGLLSSVTCPPPGWSASGGGGAKWLVLVLLPLDFKLPAAGTCSQPSLCV